MVVVTQADDEVECKLCGMSGERWTTHRFLVYPVKLEIHIILYREMVVVLILSGSFVVFLPELATDEPKLDNDGAGVKLKFIDIFGDFLVKQIVYSIPQLPR
jgi:hypothetical protein